MGECVGSRVVLWGVWVRRVERVKVESGGDVGARGWECGVCLAYGCGMA